MLKEIISGATFIAVDQSGKKMCLSKLHYNFLITTDLMSGTI